MSGFFETAFGSPLLADDTWTDSICLFLLLLCAPLASLALLTGWYDLEANIAKLSNAIAVAAANTIAFVSLPADEPPQPTPPSSPAPPSRAASANLQPLASGSVSPLPPLIRQLPKQWCWEKPGYAGRPGLASTQTPPELPPLTDSECQALYEWLEKRPTAAQRRAMAQEKRQQEAKEFADGFFHELAVETPLPPPPPKSQQKRQKEYEEALARFRDTFGGISQQIPTPPPPPPAVPTAPFVVAAPPPPPPRTTQPAPVFVQSIPAAGPSPGPFGVFTTSPLPLAEPTPPFVAPAPTPTFLGTVPSVPPPTTGPSAPPPTAPAVSAAPPPPPTVPAPVPAAAPPPPTPSFPSETVSEVQLHVKEHMDKVYQGLGNIRNHRKGVDEGWRIVLLTQSGRERFFNLGKLMKEVVVFVGGEEGRVDESKLPRSKWLECGLGTQSLEELCAFLQYGFQKDKRVSATFRAADRLQKLFV